MKESHPQLAIALCRTLMEATTTGRAAYGLSINGVRETLAATY